MILYPWILKTGTYQFQGALLFTTTNLPASNSLFTLLFSIPAVHKNKTSKTHKIRKDDTNTEAESWDSWISPVQKLHSEMICWHYGKLLNHFCVLLIGCAGTHLANISAPSLATALSVWCTRVLEAIEQNLKLRYITSMSSLSLPVFSVLWLLHQSNPLPPWSP